MANLDVTSTQYMDHSRMREMNLALILSCLRQEAPLSRSRLAEMTGLTKATVSSLVRELIERKFVCETGSIISNVGRPSINLELNPQAGTIIGLEIGVDFLSAILTNFSAQVQWKKLEYTTNLLGQQEILANSFKVLEEACIQANQHPGNLLGIGLGVPGLVDHNSGTLLFAPNLNWRDVPIRKMVEERFNIPVYVENEAQMAALGESYFGAGRYADFVLYVSSGVGLGGGIVLKKQVLQGMNGFAGEIGHITIVPDGLPCNCGNTGCWETLASQRAVFRLVRQAIERGRSSLVLRKAGGDLDRMTIPMIIEAAQAGDKVALEAFQETGHWLGIGIANLINALNPEVVVFGGILSLASDFLMPEMQSEIDRRALPWSSQNTRLVISEYSLDSCVIGGVATVYHQVLSQPGLL